MIYYTIKTENGKFKTTAQNWFTAFFKAMWLGWRSYFDLNPQRVFVEKWETIE